MIWIVGAIVALGLFEMGRAVGEMNCKSYKKPKRKRK